MLKGKHILVGISGGIAAYKIPELIRSLVKAGAEVRVATTENALQFVTELTLQTVSGSRVYSDVFAAINEHATEHISLPEWCDAMIVAPATANVLGKMAAGIADDALTTTICSCVARKPMMVAPAMNDKMWENPATQHAIETIRRWENVTVIEPAEGPLACGTSGKGRMPEIEELQLPRQSFRTHPSHRRPLRTSDVRSLHGRMAESRQRYPLRRRSGFHTGGHQPTEKIKKQEVRRILLHSPWSDHAPISQSVRRNQKKTSSTDRFCPRDGA